MKFIKNHPVWTTIIICFILCLANGYKSGEYDILGYIFLCLIILAAISPIIRKLNRKKEEKNNADYLAKQIALEINNTFTEEIEPNNSYDITNVKDYKHSYEPRYLMTLNEKMQYKKLYQWTQGKELSIFTKVRLLDLISPRKNQNNYKGLLWKIQAKHVDFVICDKDIRVKAIVEINDNSHKTKERAERDKFVTEVLKACGYNVLSTFNITEEQLNDICGYNQSTAQEQN